MSAFSMFAAVSSALRGQSLAFQTISENITNQTTPGFKGADTRFFEVLMGSGLGVAEGAATTYGGARPVNQVFVDRQGSLAPTNGLLDLAINGNGFFVTNPQRDGSGELQLTRAGQFGMQNVGFGTGEETYLVDSAGNYLLGWPADGAGGFSTGNSIGALQPIRVDRDAFLSDPAATTEAGFTANLPAEDAAGTTHQVDMGIFDDSGVEHRLSVTFTRGATPNSWDVAFAVADGTVTSPAASVAMSFDAAGNLLAPTAQNIDIAFTNAGATGTTVALDLSAVTQFAGNFTSGGISRNGNESGTLEGLQFTAGGVVNGLFSNGLSQGLYKLPLATVTSPNLLDLRNGTHYALSEHSGDLVLHEADQTDMGDFVPNTLESSTVDLPTEFSKLVLTQQAYGTSARVMTTVDEMSRVATDLKG